MTNPGKTMLQGLAAILPAALTLYILYWLGSTAETVLGGILQFVLPAGWYYPGLGLLIGVTGVYGVGLLLQGWLTRRILAWGERLLNRIPLVKTVYGSVKDLTGFFATDKRQEFDQVVALEINLGGAPCRVLGFVTRSDFTGVPSGLAEGDSVAVYLPMSYQIGGYTVIVPRSAVRPVAMSRQDAMRFTLTAGMSTDGKSPPRT